MHITLDKNSRAALTSALENYLNGCGMEQADEDEDTLEAILGVLEYGEDE